MSRHGPCHRYTVIISALSLASLASACGERRANAPDRSTSPSAATWATPRSAIANVGEGGWRRGALAKPTAEAG